MSNSLWNTINYFKISVDSKEAEKEGDAGKDSSFNRKSARVAKGSASVWLNISAASKKVLIKALDFSNCWRYRLSNTSTRTIDVLLDDVPSFPKHVSEVNGSDANVLTLQVLLVLRRVTDHSEANTAEGKGEDPQKREETTTNGTRLLMGV